MRLTSAVAGSSCEEDRGGLPAALIQQNSCAARRQPGRVEVAVRLRFLIAAPAERLLLSPSGNGSVSRGPIPNAHGVATMTRFAFTKYLAGTAAWLALACS